MPRHASRTVVLLVLASLTALASARTSVQLVLDASGSMFIRLDDGRYRIVAAKDALSDLIGRMSPDDDVDVGLRVYGARVDARDPDACLDSELLVPMDGFDRRALLDTVRDVRARGATPIAYSLQLAGDDFRPGGRNVIVLVTDGEESCGGDPAGVIADLRARGIEIELHVIGIDLSERAAEGFARLGTFVNTRSAAELGAALGRTMTTVAEPTLETHLVRVLVTRDGAPAEGVAVRLLEAVGGVATGGTSDAPGSFELRVPAGAFVAEIDDALAAEPHRFAGLTVTPEGDNVFAFDLTRIQEVTLAVEPSDPVAGGQVEVRYAGAPDEGRGWITVVPVDAPEEAFLDWAHVEPGSGSTRLRVPDEPTALEARYHLTLPEGGSRPIGRSATFTSRAVAVTLEAADEVGAGAAFEVRWEGPGNVDDYVTIVPVGAPGDAYLSYAYTARGNPAVLRAPLDPGDYEIRYASDASRGRVFASRPVRVVAQSYAVEVPEQVGAGTEFEVRWTGPDNAGDYVTIVAEGAPIGVYGSYAYTNRGNPARLRAPLEPGRYEVRYSSEQQSPNPVLASATLVVAAQAYALEVPAEVEAGARFEVGWTGPDNPGDYVTIVRSGAPVGSYLSYAYTRSGNPARLDAPVEPGAYEVRYSSEAASPNPTLAAAPITVVAMRVTLEAPDTVATGSSFEVRWTGPDGGSDYITIVPAGAPDGAYLSYAYTRDGPVVTLVAPDEPGAYEIRYASDRVAGTFGRRAITVR